LDGGSWAGLQRLDARGSRRAGHPHGFLDDLGATRALLLVCLTRSIEMGDQQ
jgi:hypothetical protein